MRSSLFGARWPSCRHREIVALMVAALAVPNGGCIRASRASGGDNGGGRTPEVGALPATWYAGGEVCAERPRFQVHAYNDDFYILRQPACTNFEKPFLYLLFGNERALLLDTGAGKIDVTGAVDAVIQRWLERHGRASI